MFHSGGSERAVTSADGVHDRLRRDPLSDGEDYTLTWRRGSRQTGRRSIDQIADDSACKLYRLMFVACRPAESVAVERWPQRRRRSAVLGRRPSAAAASAAARQHRCQRAFVNDDLSGTCPQAAARCNRGRSRRRRRRRRRRRGTFSVRLPNSRAQHTARLVFGRGWSEEGRRRARE